MKKLLAILVLVLMFCGVNFSNADTLNTNFSCVSGLKTTMDKSSEVEHGVKIEIGEKNFNDEYIQELFKKNPEMVINIKHIKTIREGNIVEIDGLYESFSGEVYFFSIPKKHFSTYLNGILYFNLEFPSDEVQIVNGKSKRVLYMSFIELTDEESQKLTPAYSNLYENKKIKLNNIWENHYAFTDELDKVLVNKKSSDALFAHACFEQ
jgi:hypothetical protein